MKQKLFGNALTMIFAAATLTPLGNAATFGEDVTFLRDHTDVIVLADHSGAGKLAIVPAWQGRVMTSSSGGDAGASYGWINRELIASGKLLPHINAFGGEDRFWMGPEGGQFSIFFPQGSTFDFANWQTPPVFDTLPFEVISRSEESALFGAKFGLVNYSGTRFAVQVERKVSLLDTAIVWKQLGVLPAGDVSMVAFVTENRITNAGKEPWTKRTGALSVWILGMFNPSPSTTIVVPIKPGPESELGVKVTSDYFGSVPADRLVVRDDVIFFAADGKFRSKIGIGPKRSKAILGSFDASNNVLTLVTFTQPEGVTDYVNSLWKLQDDPFGGDTANSYNDGPATPGAKPMGPFYELESSSPAAALAPGESLSHSHRTFHLSGPKPALDRIARAALGVSLEEIEGAFEKR